MEFNQLVLNRISILLPRTKRRLEGVIQSLGQIYQCQVFAQFLDLPCFQSRTPPVGHTSFGARRTVRSEECIAVVGAEPPGPAARSRQLGRRMFASSILVKIRAISLKTLQVRHFSRIQELSALPVRTLQLLALQLLGLELALEPGLVPG